MINLISLTLLLTIIPLFFFALNYILSKKSMNKREKISPFECGFDPMSNPRIPFSTHFFLISLIFLIFDIEITLLIPMIIMFNKFNLLMITSLSFFLIILILGLYMEYSEQSIDWKI